MQAPTDPYQPYAHLHTEPNGPGDGRPTAMQILKDCDAVGKLHDKTILITGCSAGLGIETARILYIGGARLFLTARDMPKLQKVIEDIVAGAPESKSTPRPEAVEMHLDSLQSVRRGAEDFIRRSGGKLNILINNAGVMAVPLGRTKENLETHIGVNHFAHFLLFHELKSVLIRTALASGSASRMINVSSAGHRYSGMRFDDVHFDNAADYSWQAGYGQSKTANIYMASSIARHYGDKNIMGLSLHPGAIHTELGRYMNQTDIDRLVNANKSAFKSVEQGAATTVWAVVSPHFEGKNNGRYLADCGECAPMPKDPKVATSGYGPHVYNEEAEEKLWKLSCETVHVPIDS